MSHLVWLAAGEIRGDLNTLVTHAAILSGDKMVGSSGASVRVFVFRRACHCYLLTYRCVSVSSSSVY